MTRLSTDGPPRARQTKGGELKPALKFILLVVVIVWFPLFYWVTGGWNPGSLFREFGDFGVALMFFCGAVIANATAVGGGMVFNPTLQLVFGVSGLSALCLAVLGQCFGMSSGSYGWYKKGEYARFHARDLWTLIILTVFFAVIFEVVFLALIKLAPKTMLTSMKFASMVISFYVFGVVWVSIRQRKIAASVMSQTQENTDPNQQKRRIDFRIYPWLALGVMLNVATSVGVGELVFSHLIKYYRTPPKTAVAAGTLLQAVCVVVQAVFILIFLSEYILIGFVMIGLLFCAIGGRLAPYLLTRPLIEPFAEHILAFAALTMGLASGLMLLL